jgi:hypothetical protein
MFDLHTKYHMPSSNGLSPVFIKWQAKCIFRTTFTCYLHSTNFFVKKRSLTFKVLTAVKIWIMVYRVVTPCSLIGGYQRVRRTNRLHRLHMIMEVWKAVKT